MKKWSGVLLIVLFVVVLSFGLYGLFKPLPQGMSHQGEIYNDSAVEFLYDLSYEKDGQMVHEHVIFDKIISLIRESEEFLVLDMFLFNDHYDCKSAYPELASTLTKALVAQKHKNPDMDMIVLTDDINTFYGAYPSKYLEQLQANGIDVVITDLKQLRDSNPLYSSVWRTFGQWFETGHRGWLKNAFSADAPQVTLRAYLKLLNFKANHRKVVMSEKQALVSSGNPHDASAYHSNIAFLVEGGIIQDLLETEEAVARMSHKLWPIKTEPRAEHHVSKEEVPSELAGERAETTAEKLTDEIAEKRTGGIAEKRTEKMAAVRVLTEGKIRARILEALESTQAGDEIKMGMFYLSERTIIKELLAASERGVKIKLILDPNKDAFGLEKNGIPNRPVAAELNTKSKGKIETRWYLTHGEQYHTKLILITGQEKSIIFGGSANLTRKNLRDYNLETDLEIVADHDSQVVQEITAYFRRIWNNEQGTYTADGELYREESLTKRMLYLFQEWTGLTTV